MENYTLNEKDGATDLAIEIDVTEEYEQYFRDTFPKALNIVKSLSEK